MIRGLLLPAAILVLWEAGSRAGRLPHDTFSSPSAIAIAFAHGIADGSILAATAETLAVAAWAWLVALVLGVLVGGALGATPALRSVVGIAVEMLRPIPSVALIPLALVLFGYGFRLEAWVIGFAVFWPVLLLTAAGVRAIDPRLIEVGRALGFSGAQRFVRFALPGALPSIAVGARVGAGFALVVAVTVEIAVNPRGLGFAMITAQQQFRADRMYADLLWLGAIGVAINALMVELERRALRWTTFMAAR